MAERVGFEPTVRLHVQRFSRPPRSTTPAPLRENALGRTSAVPIHSTDRGDKPREGVDERSRSIGADHRRRHFPSPPRQPVAVIGGGGLREQLGSPRSLPVAGAASRHRRHVPSPPRQPVTTATSRHHRRHPSRSPAVAAWAIRSATYRKPCPGPRAEGAPAKRCEDATPAVRRGSNRRAALRARARCSSLDPVTTYDRLIRRVIAKRSSSDNVSGSFLRCTRCSEVS